MDPVESNLSPDDVLVTLLCPQDAALLVRFFTENRLEFFENAVSDPKKYIEDYLSSYSKRCIAAFEMKGRSGGRSVVAFANIDVWARPRGGKIAYLGEVYVDARWRRKGIASRLVTALVEEAARLGCHRIILHCRPDAMAIYQKTGFSEWERGMCLNLVVRTL